MDGRPQLARTAPEQQAVAGDGHSSNPDAIVTLDAPPPPPGDSSPGSAPLSAGDRVAHFVIRGRIGQGGMGVIYRAMDEQLEREVALKVLPPAVATDPDRRRRLLREARSAAAVSHPHIATIHEVGETEGRIFVAMELVAGKSLAQRIDEEALDVDEAAGLATQILDGLACAHAAGIVHRDLKPANVMITPRGIVKVLDFGLAVRRSEPGLGAAMESTLTADGQLVGTPAYMAPEQVRGEAVDARTDLFSFGVLFFEMLTGRLPFEGRTVADTLSAILRDDPPSLTKLRPGTPSALVRIIERCLAKEPAARFASCEEVSAALRNAVSGLDRTNKVQLTSSADVVAPPAPPRRSYGRWIAGACALAVTAGAALVVVGTRSGTAPSAAPVATATATGSSARPLGTGGFAITDRPLPHSEKPEAIAEYAAALHAFRDANWNRAQARLKRALEIDPSLSAARLRLSLMSTRHDGHEVGESAELYTRAVEGRASLDARDQAILAALAPYHQGEAVNPKVARAKWREAIDKFPDDAELASIGAFFETDLDPAYALSEGERATTIDPGYADAWQLRARALTQLNRIDEARAALDRCAELSPIADDCLLERGLLANEQGRCDAMEKDFQQLMSRSKEGFAYEPQYRADALHALGQPEEAVLATMRVSWERTDPKERAEAERRSHLLLDIAHGRFADAERKLREDEQAAPPDQKADHRTGRALTWMRVLQEMGRDKEALQVAEAFQKRKGGWIGVVPPGQDMELLRPLLHAGSLSQAAFDEQRARVLSHLGSEASPWDRWLVGEVVAVMSPAEAQQALSTIPPHAPELERRHHLWNPVLGRAYLLAGRHSEAAEALRLTTSTCLELERPWLQIHARFELGRALELSGDRAGACKAYSAVLDRWGKASPRSVTAEQAKARVTALACQ